MEELTPGAVVVLPAGAVVLSSRRDLIVLDLDTECVIEGVRSFDPGSEDDHFLPGSVIDLRALVSGEYDALQPILTVALSGDFEPRFIQADLTVVRRMRKTYV